MIELLKISAGSYLLVTICLFVLPALLSLWSDYIHVHAEFTLGLAEYLGDRVGLRSIPRWLPGVLTIGAAILAASPVVAGLCFLWRGELETCGLAFIVGGAAKFGDRAGTHDIPTWISKRTSPGSSWRWAQLGSGTLLLLIGFAFAPQGLRLTALAVGLLVFPLAVWPLMITLKKLDNRYYRRSV